MSVLVWRQVADNRWVLERSEDRPLDYAAMTALVRSPEVREMIEAVGEQIRRAERVGWRVAP